MASKPLIGITTYVEPASWGHWQLEAALVPYDYVRAVERAGGRAVLVPPDDDGSEELLDALDGLIFSGGNDLAPESYGAEADPTTTGTNPARDSGELALLTAALERDLPVLAICRGSQVLNVALGGTLVQDIPSQEPSDIEHSPADKRAERVHSVDIEAGSRLARIVGAEHIRTNSSHHKSVRRTASALKVTARSEDGIIEALEPRDPAWWAVAVQWHPEELTNTEENWDRRLFAAFGAAVREAGRD